MELYFPKWMKRESSLINVWFYGRYFVHIVNVLYFVFFSFLTYLSSNFYLGLPEGRHEVISENPVGFLLERMLFCLLMLAPYFIPIGSLNYYLLYKKGHRKQFFIWCVLYLLVCISICLFSTLRVFYEEGG